MFAYGPTVKEDKDRKVQDLVRRSKELRGKIDRENDPIERARLVNQRGLIKSELEYLLKDG